MKTEAEYLEHLHQLLDERRDPLTDPLLHEWLRKEPEALQRVVELRHHLYRLETASGSLAAEFVPVTPEALVQNRYPAWAAGFLVLFFFFQGLHHLGKPSSTESASARRPERIVQEPVVRKFAFAIEQVTPSEVTASVVDTQTSSFKHVVQKPNYTFRSILTYR